MSCGPFTFAAFDLIKKDLQEDFDSSILSYFFLQSNHSSSAREDHDLGKQCNVDKNYFQLTTGNAEVINLL